MIDPFNSTWYYFCVELKGLQKLGREASLPGVAAHNKLFQAWQKEVEHAKAIYFQVMDETERQIEELRKNALSRVADKLAEEFGETQTVEALRGDNPSFLVAW